MHAAVNPEPSPSAGQDTGQMRDEIAAVLRKDYESEHETSEPVSAWYPVADEILDLPSLRQLIAERDQARAQVQRVQRVVDNVAADPGHYIDELWVYSMRNALSGDDA